MPRLRLEDTAENDGDMSVGDGELLRTVELYWAQRWRWLMRRTHRAEVMLPAFLYRSV